MPEGYSWVTHTISESAAQGIEGAWLANTLDTVWARGAVWLHTSFGVFMVATAAFSHQPWIAGIPYDRFEDTLHSFAATAMGFAFSLGVVIRLWQRAEHDRFGRLLDIIALVAATAIPLLMFYNSTIAGLVQRIMFLVAYIWYGTQALMVYRASIAKNLFSIANSSQPR